jgi:hypothetical protein
MPFTILVYDERCRDKEVVDMTSFVNIAQIVLVAALAAIVFLVLRFLTQIRNLTEDTRQMVGRGVKIDPRADQLFDLAVNVWRLKNHYGNISGKLDEKEQKRFVNSIDRITRFLVTNDIEMADYNNRPYNNGLNIEVMNTEADESVSTPMIHDTLSPEIRHKGIIRKHAQVIVHTPAEAMEPSLKEANTEGKSESGESSKILAQAETTVREQETGDNNGQQKEE